jgi:IclR family acetate operon transcriptional repressor
VETSQAEHTTNRIQSVLKALDVLECLADAEQPLSVREVAQQCGFSRPTAYRLLATLLSRDYVQNIDDGHYHIGTRILTLGKSFLDRLDIPEIARKDIQSLSQLARETVHLSVLDGTEILYIDKAQVQQSVQMYCTIGTRNPLYNTSMGKAILAFLPPEKRDALLDRIALTRCTPNTITGRTELVEHLQMVRERGYAIDDMENEEGIRCLGAPIFDYSGEVIGALSVSGPAHRLPDARIAELAEPVMQTARTISSKLGSTASPMSA